jgi:hypothetical protein
MYGYVACCASQLMHSAGKHNIRNHDTPAHRPHNPTLYDIPPIRSGCISGNSDGSKKLPDDGRLLSKHVGASILNKGMVQFSA